MAEHKHGSMDIKDQEKTFEGFMSWTVKAGIAILVIVIFLALAAT